MPAITRPTLTRFNERGQCDNSTFDERIGVDVNSTRRKVWCAWSERFKAARAFLGYSQLERDGGGAVIGLRRLTPLKHPDNTGDYVNGAPYLWASAVGSTPYKVTGNAGTSAVDTSGRSNFQQAQIEIEYANPRYIVKEDADVTSYPAGNEWERYTRVEGGTSTSNYIMLPGGTLKYFRSAGAAAPHGLPINYNYGKVLTIQEIKLTWCRLPYDLYQIGSLSNWAKRIWGVAGTPPLLGKVNKTSFLGYPAGIVLFSDIRPIIRDSYFDVTEWDFEITLAIDMNGWNYKYYSPAAGASGRGWYKVATDSYYAEGSTPDDKSIYNEGALNYIFDVRDTVP